MRSGVADGLPVGAAVIVAVELGTEPHCCRRMPLERRRQRQKKKHDTAVDHESCYRSWQNDHGQSRDGHSPVVACAWVSGKGHPFDLR